MYINANGKSVAMTNLASMEKTAPAPGLMDRLPPALAALFAASPLRKGEDADGFCALLNEVAAAIEPTDLVEFLWVRDFTELTWEIARHRRLQRGILDTGELPALRARFRTQINPIRHLGVDLDPAQAAVNWHADPSLREHREG